MTSPEHERRGAPTAVDHDLARLEERLDSFDASDRREALAGLKREVVQGRITLPESGTDVNLHCHTFFSYNAYGYSPTKFAWLARKTGLAVAGVVDFDVVDGLEDFLEAGSLLGLKACVGMETRVFLPEFADQVMNSPGEPGICYYLGVGFPKTDLVGAPKRFLSDLRRVSAERNRQLVGRLNEHLIPVALDYDRDVLPLTPSGNATERHICLAWARRARSVYPDDGELAEFWRAKLDAELQERDLPEGVRLQDLIRSKTMKQGGVGYVRPDTGSFPRMADTSRFITAAGGIPAYAWLDGTSPGEQKIEALLAAAMSTGAAAVNIIPDRNYTPGETNELLANLYQIVALAEELCLPVVVGTEMNSPGQKFVDDFSSQELQPLAPVFLRGAQVIYGHSVLQREAGLGYTSAWAERRFPDRAARNEFYQIVGERLQPSREHALNGVEESAGPEAILARIGR